MILMYLHSKTYVTFRFLVISDVFFFPLPKFKHLDLRPFLFLFSSQGVRECRDECGWIKYQQQGVWVATGAQRNTLSVSNTMICTIFFSLKITSSTKTDLYF